MSIGYVHKIISNTEETYQIIWVKTGFMFHPYQSVVGETMKNKD